VGVQAAAKSAVGRLGWTGGTLLVTGWLGFMFATALAAVFPSVHALTAPIVCHAPYTHFVVHTNNFSYGNGTTTGYTLNFTCANDAGAQRPIGGPGQIWLLWAFGWAASLVLAAVFHLVRVLVRRRGAWPAVLVTLAALAAGIYALTAVPYSNNNYIPAGGHVASARQAVDPTTAPLPPPSGSAVVSPSDPSSLFAQKGLIPVLRKLITAFGASASVVQLAIYPGELEMVVTDNNDNARLVTASAGGKVTVGQPRSFNGSRQAVNLSQISAPAIAQIEHSLRQARSTGGVPIKRIERFVLDLSHNLAQWKIYASGIVRYYGTLLDGSGLWRVTRTGATHYLF
jgi:hypothetical protein